MSTRPPIAEPLLLERLAMSREEYLAYLATITKTIPPRAYDVALYERGLGYPWERPQSSYFMHGKVVEPVAEMDDARREAIFGRFAVAEGRDAESLTQRHPQATSPPPPRWSSRSAG